MLEDFNENISEDETLNKNNFYAFKHWYETLINAKIQLEININDAFSNLLKAYGTIEWLKITAPEVNIENTQLVDLSNVVKDITFKKQLTEKLKGQRRKYTNNYRDKDISMSMFIATLNIESIELPFEEAFYKVTGSTEDDLDNMFIYIKEVSPEFYQAISLVHNADCPILLTIQMHGTEFIIQCKCPSLLPITIDNEVSETTTHLLYTAANSLLNCLSKLNRLNHKSNVYRYKGETPKRKYKMNGKKVHLKKTVYVYLDSEKETPLEYTNSKLKREISWIVRGHWRRINPDSLGKNAKDERVVQGFTWIRPHMCGDGNNKQTRTLIVKENKNSKKGNTECQN